MTTLCGVGGSLRRKFEAGYRDRGAPRQPASVRAQLLLLLSGRDLRLLLRRFACGPFSFVLFVGHIVPADPGEAHLVDGSATPGADPVLRVRVELVGRGVVVPGDDVQERARWDNRRH